jgi:nucleotidyltransferase substrate binding protein (TIGR01987 family)
MNDQKDIRWKQRFSNYKKALNSLKGAVDLAHKRELTDLEKQGMIQAFEFTHELCWKTMKDFIIEKGNQEVFGSRDAVREAFNLGLIFDGESWMLMIESRNLSSHTYNSEVADKIVRNIIHTYFDLFVDFESSMTKHFGKA